jgi:hypothetical protein
MARKRGLDARFLAAMRKKLEHGRTRGRVGWDRHWENCGFRGDLKGVNGELVGLLLTEVVELIVALAMNDPDDILEEAADVANFAMFIADSHAEHKHPRKGNLFEKERKL